MVEVEKEFFGWVFVNYIKMDTDDKVSLSNSYNLYCDGEKHLNVVVISNKKYFILPLLKNSIYS